GADLVCVLDERLERRRVRAGNRKLEVDLQAEAGLVLVELHRAGDLRRLAVEAVLLGEEKDRLAEAGRVAERKQLLRVVALARAAELLRQRHGERQRATLEHRAPVASALRRRRGLVGHERL